MPHLQEFEMQFPESWLRSFVNPSLSSDELAHALTMSGIEVEGRVPAAAPFSSVVVGHVLEVAKHPDADRLNVCRVDVGQGEPLQIVCGAPNVAPGIKVPTALVGAELQPGEAGGEPFRIKLGKLRGVESAGMLCSARELKLSEDHGGLLILPDDAPVGQSIRAYLDLDDLVFEVKLTPNKADCLSVFGIAREVAAITGAPLTSETIVNVPVTLDEVVPVSIRAPDLCGRFSGRVIRGVDAHAKTPDWMVRRLARSGQRSLSALVDISNYVMLELGRPTHVFDLDKLSGGMEVRWGKAGEQLKLLNGSTVALDEQVGVIAGAQGVESLAGIMGGDHTAVTLDTKNVYVEAAFWWPDSIRGRARRFNFSTDAGHRFERGVDYATTVEHLERITRLIVDICGGQVGPIDDQIVNLPVRKPVTMRVSRAVRVLGIALDNAVVADVFTRLGLSFEQAGDVFTVTPPSYRFDIEIEEDLIEEVARIYGFEKIPARPPVAPSRMRSTDERHRSIHHIRHRIAARDYAETVSFGFVEAAWEADFGGNANPIKLLNPIASQLSVMRSSLIGSLVDVLRNNLSRRAERVRLFEVGRVFLRDVSVAAGEMSIAGIAQPVRVGGLAYGAVAEEQWGESSRPVDYFDMKGDVEAWFAPHVPRFVRAEHPAFHPGRSARIELDGTSVGYIGELHPRWQQKYDLPRAPILFEVDASALSDRDLPAPVSVSKFPPVRRDIAVVVARDIDAQSLMDTLEEARREPVCQIVQRIALFDEFRPDAVRSGGLEATEKSLAFRISLQDTGGTLLESAVEMAVQTLVDRLARAYGARLRG